MGAFERITVKLPSETAEVLRRSVADGEFGSTSEIIDLALRDWVRAQGSDKLQLQRLRLIIAEGDDSGPSIPAGKAFAQVRARIVAKMATR